MRKGWIISGAVGLALGVAGIASAAIIGTDSTGSVSGTVGTLHAITVTGTVSADVFPGHNYGVHLVGDNSANSVDVQVDTLTPYEIDFAGTQNAVIPGQDVAGFGSVNTITEAPGAVVIPAGNALGAWDYAAPGAGNAVVVDSGADLGPLHGQSFTIKYHVTVESH